MPRAATFAEYYSLPSTGVGGDGNVKSFNKAMDPEANQWDAARALNNADGIILMSGPGKKIKIIHGLIDFGNTISNPTIKVCGHTGMGDTAFCGKIDYGEALSNIRFDTPTDTDFQAATTKEALQNLQRPGAASLGDTYDGTKVFIVIPTAQRAIMQCRSTCPLDIILAAREAMIKLIDSLGQEDSHLIDELDIHLSNLIFFCWGVHNDLIPPEALFESDADDVQLNEFSRVYHRQRIISHHSKTTTPATVPPAENSVHEQNLNFLTATLSRVVGDQNKSADILEKMHEFNVEMDRKKKDKTKNWHEVTKKLFLYAASTDGVTPATTLPSSLRDIINANTIGEADINLGNQMEEMGLDEIGWSANLTLSLRNGQVLYKEAGVPSGFSIFMIMVKEPTGSNEQQVRGMELHLLEQHKDNNKEVLEMVKAKKNQIKIPKHFEDFSTHCKGLLGLSAITFGISSLLTKALQAFCENVENRRMTLKTKFHYDQTLIAKIMYAVDTRLQLWLSDGRTATDREEMDDGIIDLVPIITNVHMDQLVVSLPSCLNPTLRKPPEDDDESEEPKSPRRKKKKVKDDEDKTSKNRKVVNHHAPASFRLLEGESYKNTFANKHVDARPMWGGNCKMCPRWNTLGYCFADCKHKDSHVSGDDIPTDKKAAYDEYLAICRRN